MGQSENRSRIRNSKALLHKTKGACNRHAISSCTAYSGIDVLHALGAGLVIGLIYGRMPAISVILGVAIVSHKLPAGYAAARNLQRRRQSVLSVLLPACGVGLVCIPTSMVVAPSEPGHGTAVFGFATGAFLYVAVEFMYSATHCGTGRYTSRWVFAAILGALLVTALMQLTA